MEAAIPIIIKPLTTEKVAVYEKSLLKGDEMNNSFTPVSVFTDFNGMKKNNVYTTVQMARKIV